MKTILLATGNPGKLKEIEALLAQAPSAWRQQITLALPQQFGLALEVVEDGQSYAENAAKKAVAFCQASGLLTLADDSGLEVDALGGQPGLHSARYSPQPGASDADRRALLLHNLRQHPRPWTAHFHCTVAIAIPAAGAATPQLHYAEGQVMGEIIPAERGSNGFGYDPIFLLPELGRTMAELTMAEKNELSHRARAVKAAIPILMQLT
jgi:XTP/dITP diphosphohydrolase